MTPLKLLEYSLIGIFDAFCVLVVLSALGVVIRKEFQEFVRIYFREQKAFIESLAASKLDKSVTVDRQERGHHC